jgi:hypothetical protein
MGVASKVAPGPHALALTYVDVLRTAEQVRYSEANRKRVAVKSVIQVRVTWSTHPACRVPSSSAHWER